MPAAGSGSTQSRRAGHARGPGAVVQFAGSAARRALHGGGKAGGQAAEMTGSRPMNLPRRAFMARCAGATGALLFHQNLAPLLAAPEDRGFLIGACDWSIGKMADPGALDVAREIGLDGVQVSLGTVGNDMALRQRKVQEAYRRKSAETGVRIASLAIGELNSIPFKSDPRT